MNSISKLREEAIKVSSMNFLDKNKFRSLLINFRGNIVFTKSDKLICVEGSDISLFKDKSITLFYKNNFAYVISTNDNPIGVYDSSMKGLFKDFKCRSIILDDFDSSNVKNMSWCFSNCNNITKLNLNNINTDKVEDYSYLVHNCKKLSSINIKSFNINKSSKVMGMLSKCDNLVLAEIPEFLEFNDSIYDKLWIEEV